MKLISLFYFVLFCLKGVTRRGIKLLSEDLGDISLPLCPEPWTELLTPRAERTKHQSPLEGGTMSRGGGSHVRVARRGPSTSARTAEVRGFSSFTRDYFEVFGILCLQVTLQAVSVES